MMVCPTWHVCSLRYGLPRLCLCGQEDDTEYDVPLFKPASLLEDSIQLPVLNKKALYQLCAHYSGCFPSILSYPSTENVQSDF